MSEETSGQTGESPEKKHEETRKYILEDWKLKADQRLRTFNFFIIVYGVVAAGLLTFIKDSRYPWIAGLGGLWLALVSYVFWRIDCRSKTMLANSEEIFRELELDFDEKFRVFCRDKKQCDLEKSERSFFAPWIFPMTFHESFRLLFLAFGLGGFFLAIASFCLSVQAPAPSPIPVQQIFNVGTAQEKK